MFSWSSRDDIHIYYRNLASGATNNDSGCMGTLVLRISNFESDRNLNLTLLLKIYVLQRCKAFVKFTTIACRLLQVNLLGRHAHQLLKKHLMFYFTFWWCLRRLWTVILKTSDTCLNSKLVKSKTQKLLRCVASFQTFPMSHLQKKTQFLSKYTKKCAAVKF